MIGYSLVPMRTSREIREKDDRWLVSTTSLCRFSPQTDQSGEEEDIVRIVEKDLRSTDRIRSSRCSTLLPMMSRSSARAEQRPTPAVYSSNYLPCVIKLNSVIFVSL